MSISTKEPPKPRPDLLGDAIDYSKWDWKPLDLDYNKHMEEMKEALRYNVTSAWDYRERQGKPETGALDFNEALAAFQVGDPIRSLFKPRYRMYPNAYGYRHNEMILELTIQAPDADERSAGTIPITTQRLLPEHQLREMSRKGFHDFLRTMLHQILLHEADEAIKVDGRKIYDPHSFDRVHKDRREADALQMSLLRG